MNANKFMDTVTLKQYDDSGLMYCYLLTNTNNNKSYVGITNNPKRRWTDHRWSVNDKVCGNNPLYRSIAKNGSDAFDIKILSTNKTREGISLDEIKYIKEYNTFIYPDRKGYNLTKGGENGFESRPLSAEACKKISIANKEQNLVKHLSKFHKENPDFARENAFTQWKDPKFRKARTGKNHWASKAVVIFGIEYESIQAAANAHDKTEGFVKYHACPNQWNNWDPKKHSNSYFINQKDTPKYPFTFMKEICFNKKNQWYILN
tara:strand:- start:83 stop:868 length:786 start_codon:yes stop_codon:yes gene_type:complete